MIKYLLALFLLFIPHTFLFAQSNADILDKLSNDVTIGQTKTTDLEKTIKEVGNILKDSSLTTVERLKGMLILANLHKLKGDNKTSLEVAEKARNLASKKRLYLWEARLLGYISSMYRISEMMELSHEKLQEALNTAKKAPESEELYKFYSNAFHEMAYYATDSNEFQEAISYLEKSNFYLKKINNANSDFLMASNYQYTGTLFNRMQQADSALYYFNGSLKLMDGYTDVNTKTLQNYVNTSMGYAYLLKNDLKATKRVLTKVLNDSSQFRTIDLNQDLYNNWISYYEHIKDIDSMKIYKNKLDSINGIIFKANTEAINSVTKKLNNENKQLKQSKKASYWYSIILFPFVIAGIFWISRKKYKQSNVLQVKKETKPEELKIAKETEERLVEQVKIFEQEKQYLTKNISSSVMANLLNTNAKYITHILNKMYEQDFYTYINTLKIKYITDLLDKDPQYRQYKISYLAEMTGFSSHSKFAEVFKKIKGCSPSEYIQNLRTLEGN